MAHCHRASVAGDPPRDRPPPPTRGNGGQACALSARGPLALARLLGRAPGIRRPCAPRDPAVRDSPSRTTYRRTGARGIRLGMAAVGLSVLASGAPGAGIPIYQGYVNRNALYDLVRAVALVLIFRGACAVSRSAWRRGLRSPQRATGSGPGGPPGAGGADPAASQHVIASTSPYCPNIRPRYSPAVRGRAR